MRMLTFELPAVPYRPFVTGCLSRFSFYLPANRQAAVSVQGLRAGDPLTWGANNTEAGSEKLLFGQDFCKKSCLFGQTA